MIKSVVRVIIEIYIIKKAIPISIALKSWEEQL